MTKTLASGSIVVKHLTQNPKIKGSDHAPGTGREKTFVTDYCAPVA